MELHLSLYTCTACGLTNSFWVPRPPPTEVVLKGGGCQRCTTPQNHFTLKREDG